VLCIPCDSLDRFPGLRNIEFHFLSSGYEFGPLIELVKAMIRKKIGTEIEVLFTP
jgi:hypothetical protein